jgi:hypothetical protein
MGGSGGSVTEVNAAMGTLVRATQPLSGASPGDNLRDPVGIDARP